MFVMHRFLLSVLCFFCNDTATTEIYTLSLHDALPISSRRSPSQPGFDVSASMRIPSASFSARRHRSPRSEEHTSELQSLTNLVCRLLLEKKKKANITLTNRRDHRPPSFTVIVVRTRAS